jgi:acetyltransferase-like isoleucine patch superfamily enzyme
MTMRVKPRVGAGLVADDGVIIGYPSGRGGSGSLLLGKGARLRSGTVLYHGARIGDRFETGHHVVVREDTVIGDHVSVWSNSVVDYGCHIAHRVKIHANCYLAQFTRIEHGAFLAPGVVCANDLYPGRADSAAAMTGPTIRAGAQIGANVTILPFVVVGDGALVGAGSVVTRDVPAGMVAYGCPAVAVRAVDDLEPMAQRMGQVGGAGGQARAGGGRP